LKLYVRKLIEDNQGVIMEGNVLWNFFLSLIGRHPQAKDKIGCGIEKIKLGRNYSGGCAVDLKRVDGTYSDISWVSCVTGRGKTPKANLLSAMRLAIDDEIKFFSDNDKSIFCGICDKLLDDDFHIDHEIPFKDLAERFLSTEAKHPTDFGDDPSTNQAKFKDCDELFCKRWKEFHFYEATLRKTHAYCNLYRRG